MPRHRSVLGRVAITVVIGLGLPSLTAAASDGSEPGPSGPSTENSVSTVSGGADVGASESTTTTTTAPDTTTSTTAAPTSTEVPATTQVPTTTEVPAPTPQTPTTIETAATSTAQAPTNTQVPLAAPQKPTTLEIAPPSTPPLVPSEPMGITSTPGDGSVTLHWTPPAADGDSPILRYTIEHQKSGTADWVPDGDVGTATSALVTGLTNGTTYLFQITAVNAIGPGTPAAAKDTPRTVPTAPRSPAAVPLNEPGKIRLTWALPTFDGGSAITGYVIQRSADGVSGWKAVTVGVSVTVYTVTGLTPGARYYFRVSARNDVGGGASSGVVNAVARGVSSAPRSLTAAPTMVSGQIRVSWTAPLTNGGSAVTDYAIQRSPNGTTWATVTDGTSTATAYTVTGLTNGTRYYFRVYARNAFGSSPASSVSNAIPVNALLAPRSLAAAPTNLSGQVRLTWTAPLSDGGSAITDYVIRRSPNGSTGWTTIADGVNGTRAYTVTGLSNGTRYYFRVYARTSRATSPSSNIVNAIPRTKPSAPRSAGCGADQSVRPGPPQVGCAVVERRLGDHRLHHPTVRERHDLDQHQRRSQHGDGLHRRRTHEWRPLLLPDSRQERCWHQSDQRGRQRDPENRSERADGAPWTLRSSRILPRLGGAGLQRRVRDHGLRTRLLERAALGEDRGWFPHHHAGLRDWAYRMPRLQGCGHERRRRGALQLPPPVLARTFR